MKTHSTRIVFIGGGNMASALLTGLARDATYELRVADPGELQRTQLAKLPGVTTFVDNIEAIEGADCVIFAVKPQIMRTVCQPLASTLANTSPLLITVAAGITCSAMSQWCGGSRRIVRVMPNTPALIGEGATGTFGDIDVTEADRILVDEIFQAVGLSAWVDSESLIDAVTAISGSGPAYFFYLLEALENAGCAQGLPRELAQNLARQTALGAARMALTESGTLETLRKRVTSPGGTTAAALSVLEDSGLPSIMDTAVAAARSRAIELADEFGTE